jgi:hypothetical protein
MFLVVFIAWITMLNVKGKNNVVKRNNNNNAKGSNSSTKGND